MLTPTASAEPSPTGGQNSWIVRVGASFGFGLILLIGWSATASASASDPTADLVPASVPAITAPLVLVEQLPVPVTAAIEPVVQPVLEPIVKPIVKPAIERALPPVIKPVLLSATLPSAAPIATPARRDKPVVTTIAPAAGRAHVRSQTPIRRPAASRGTASRLAPAPVSSAFAAKGTGPSPAGHLPAPTPATCGPHQTNTTSAALLAITNDPGSPFGNQPKAACSDRPSQAESTVASGPDATPD